MGQSMVPNMVMTADIQDCGKGWLRRQRGLVYMIPLLRWDEDSESILKMAGNEAGVMGWSLATSLQLTQILKLKTFCCM